HYESEIGRFENALCPDVDTFREEIEYVTKVLEDKKDAKILMYCTGGVRCEKASAYLKHKGFQNVNQLYGGIIEYARQIKELSLDSKFRGKNFVFDERLGERITDDIIARCHQCGTPCDTHTNCANDDCHLLFIQCPACAEKHAGCCSEQCHDIIHLPQDERIKIRESMRTQYAQTQIFRSRLRPRKSITNHL
ncbi:MAG: rhodanese-related sulfurtransferase, partial [Paludibacter sp.]|nr:rhodanese-related sulfurtransferase [Paludibacter sp.]